MEEAYSLCNRIFSLGSSMTPRARITRPLQYLPGHITGSGRCRKREDHGEALDQLELRERNRASSGPCCSVAQEIQLVEAVHDNATCYIAPNGGGHFPPGQPAPMDSSPQLINLPRARVTHLGAGFLRLMDAECSQEARQAAETRAMREKPKQQVPIQRKAEALVHRPPGLFPDLASPEKRFLRHEVDPAQDLVPVGGHDPPADLQAGFIDGDPVPVHHVHGGL